METLRGTDGDRLRKLVGEALDRLEDEQRAAILAEGEQTGGLRTEVRRNGDGTLTVLANGVVLVNVPLWQVSVAPPRIDA